MLAFQMIRRTKERFKLNLLAESERLKKRISALLSELQANGHHNLGPPPEEALAVCQNFRDRLAMMMEKENEIRSGLLIFKIDQQPCKESALIQKVRTTVLKHHLCSMVKNHTPKTNFFD